MFAVFLPGFVALCLLFFSPQTNAQLQDSVPVLKVDLRQFGYEVLTDEERNWLPNCGPNSILFTDKNTLAVYFVRRTNAPTPPVRRSAGPSGVYLLKAMFLDSSKGTFRTELSWPTNPSWFRSEQPCWSYSAPQYSRSSILAAHDGKFVVYAGRTLRLYSPDFKLLHERETDVRILDTTPGGHRVYLRDESRPATTNEWIDVETFKEILSTTDNLPLTLVSASEGALVGFGRASLWYLPVGEKPRELCPAELCRGMVPSAFLSKEKILVSATDGFKMLTAKGDITGSWAFEKFPGKKEGVRDLQVSLDRGRFAIMVDYRRSLRIKNLELRRGTNIVLFSAETDVPISALHVEPPRNNGRYLDYGFALSPDGSRLALLDGPQISIYQLVQR